MIDIVAGAGHVEGMSPEWFLSFDHGFDRPQSNSHRLDR
jgi:hypothetical protein